MATLGSINIAMSADSARLNKDLKRASKYTKKNTKSMSADLKRLAGVLIATFSLQATKSFIQDLDDIAKNARTAGLASSEFQLLSAAIERTGISSATTLKTIVNINKAIGEARIGTMTYTRALGLIGLRYQDLATLDPSSRILSVVEALRQQEDVTLRAAAGNILLGRAFKESGTLIDGGAEAIRNSIKELESLGIVINDDILGTMEMLNDSGQDLQLQFRAITAEALIPMFKSMLELIESSKIWVKENRGLIRTGVELTKITIKIYTAIFLARKIAILYTGSLALMKTAQLSYAASTLGAAKAMRLLNLAIRSNPVGFIIGGLTALAVAATLVTSDLDELSAVLNDIGDEGVSDVKALSDSLQIVKPDADLINESLNETKKLLRDIKKIAGPIQGLLRMPEGTIFNPAQGGNIRAPGTAGQIAGPIQGLVAAMTTVFDPSNPEFGGALEHVKTLGEVFGESFLEGFENIHNSSNSVANNMVESFKIGTSEGVGALTEGLSFALQAQSQYSEKMFKLNKKVQSAAILVDTGRAIVNALSNVPFPFNLAAATIVGALGHAQLSAVQGQQFQARQFGGPVTGGNPYLVGENGPELIVPDSNGTVIPNAADRGNITVNMHNRYGAGAISSQVADATTSDLLKRINNSLVDNGGADFSPDYINA